MREKQWCSCGCDFMLFPTVEFKQNKSFTVETETYTEPINDFKNISYSYFFKKNTLFENSPETGHSKKKKLDLIWF